MEYDNTDKGALFKNDKKETEKHPDYKGSLNVGGTDYWISGWLKTSKAGAKYMSLSVSAKDENKAPRKEYASKAEQRRADDDGFGDQEIPF